MPFVCIMLLQSINGAVLNYEKRSEVVGAALTAKARALLSAGRMTILSNNLQSKVHDGTPSSGRLARRVIEVSQRFTFIFASPRHSLIIITCAISRVTLGT